MVRDPGFHRSREPTSQDTISLESASSPVEVHTTGERQEESAVYGPFWQRGHLSGTVILLGGKSDPVSVKFQTKDKTITCKAKRGVARDLRDYIWGQPIRVEGNGRWIRDEDGVWKLLQFDISTFDPLDDEPLTTTASDGKATSDTRHKDPCPFCARTHRAFAQRTC